MKEFLLNLQSVIKIKSKSNQKQIKYAFGNPFDMIINLAIWQRTLLEIPNCGIGIPQFGISLFPFCGIRIWVPKSAFWFLMIF